MPPAAVAVGSAVAPIVLSKIMGDGGTNNRQVYGQAQGMSAAELAEQQRKAAANAFLDKTYRSRYESAPNVDMERLKAIFGNQAGLAAQMLPGMWQEDALRGLTGVTGDVATGTINAESGRQYLRDEASTAAAGGMVNNIVNSLLDFADQKMAGKVPKDFNTSDFAPGGQWGGNVPGLGPLPGTDYLKPSPGANYLIPGQDYPIAFR